MSEDWFCGPGDVEGIRVVQEELNRLRELRQAALGLELGYVQPSRRVRVRRAVERRVVSVRRRVARWVDPDSDA